MDFVLGESLHTLFVYTVYVSPALGDHDVQPYSLAWSDIMSDQAKRIIMHTGITIYFCAFNFHIIKPGYPKIF